MLGISQRIHKIFFYKILLGNAGKLFILYSYCNNANNDAMCAENVSNFQTAVT